MANGKDQKKRGRTQTELLIVFGLMVVVIMVFWTLPRHDFVNYDDYGYVVRNGGVRDGITWSGIKWAFTSVYENNWHPVTWLSHMTDCQLFRLNPGGHHVVNLFFHLANAVLLYLILRRTTGARWRSAMVTVLFAIHPLHVESVAWIAERKDVLSTFFMFLAILGYAGYTQERIWKRYSLVCLCYALGLMAKPMIVTLPFILLLMDVWPLNRLRWEAYCKDQNNAAIFLKLVAEKIPLFILAGASSIVTLYAQRKAMLDMENIPLFIRMENAFVSYVKYLEKTIYPTDLSVIYPYTVHLRLFEVSYCVAVILFISLVVCRAAKVYRYLPVGWFWFLGTLVPVIGIVQVGMQAMADRYTYVSIIGLFIIFAWGGYDLLRKFRWGVSMAGVFAAAAVLALSIVAHQQVGYWKNSHALFEQAVRVSANNHIAHSNLGVALAEKGEWDKALIHFHEAFRIDPGYSIAHYNLAVLYQERGLFLEAIEQYRESIKIKPTLKALNNLAVVLISKGQYDEAADLLFRAMRDDPDDAMAYNNYGLVLVHRGAIREAAVQFEKALKRDPGNEKYRNNVEKARR